MVTEKEKSQQNKTEIIITNQEKFVKQKYNIYIQIKYIDSDLSPFIEMTCMECTYRKCGNEGYLILYKDFPNGTSTRVYRNCLNRILIRELVKSDDVHKDTIVFEGLFDTKMRAVRELEKWKECIGRYMTTTIRIE